MDKQLIDILTNPNQEELNQQLRLIALTVLEEDESHFLNLYDLVRENISSPMAKLKQELANMFFDVPNPKVPMIKKHREVTGSELRDAKNWVEDHYDFSAHKVGKAAGIIK